MSSENETGAEPADWWEGAIEEDSTWTLPLDGEDGLWSTGFLPPPPRPAFLDEHVTSDGLTTCDLCTWAWSDNPDSSLHTDTSAGMFIGPIGWAVTLVIVSILSALLGAAIMITVIQCRNRDVADADQSRGGLSCLRGRRRRSPEENCNREMNRNVENDKELVRLRSRNGRRVWTWLSRRSPATAALTSTVPTVPAVNHYTLDEAYTAVGEALYAELDRPAYQNTGYVSDVDPASSAPSSAYYSDLSSPDRTYEAVGGQTGVWEMAEVIPRRQAPRLAAITETISVPSDYV